MQLHFCASIHFSASMLAHFHSLMCGIYFSQRKCCKNQLIFYNATENHVENYSCMVSIRKGNRKNKVCETPFPWGYKNTPNHSVMDSMAYRIHSVHLHELDSTQNPQFLFQWWREEGKHILHGRKKQLQPLHTLTHPQPLVDFFLDFSMKTLGFSHGKHRRKKYEFKQLPQSDFCFLSISETQLNKASTFMYGKISHQKQSKIQTCPNR